jgi:hypothetical protein
MFVHLNYLHVYNKKFDDENIKKNHIQEPWIVKMGGFMT